MFVGSQSDAFSKMLSSADEPQQMSQESGSPLKMPKIGNRFGSAKKQARKGQRLPKAPPQPDHLAELVANAVDFLTLVTEEFEKRLKHSVIAFYTAIELMLKARLMAEHWSLVVNKDADLVQFRNGDFVSVPFDEACKRLQRVVGSPVPDRTRQSFDDVRKHRNKLVHFYQDMRKPEVREQIAVEQLKAWHGLLGLVRVQWADVFSKYGETFEKLDKKFAQHRSYLRARFENLADEIAKQKKDGTKFVACSSCSFNAAKVETLAGALFESTCLVCRIKSRWIEIDCTSCEKTMSYEEDDGIICPHCQTSYTQEELADLIDDDPATPDDCLDMQTPANCSFCDGYHTVVSYSEKFICSSCLQLSDHLETCGWCNDGNNGDMEDSNWKGCNHCDGRAGWDRD